jgi:hypothetical protein
VYQKAGATQIDANTSLKATNGYLQDLGDLRSMGNGSAYLRGGNVYVVGGSITAAYGNTSYIGTLNLDGTLSLDGNATVNIWVNVGNDTNDLITASNIYIGANQHITNNTTLMVHFVNGVPDHLKKYGILSVTGSFGGDFINFGGDTYNHGLDGKVYEVW